MSVPLEQASKQDRLLLAAVKYLALILRRRVGSYPRRYTNEYSKNDTLSFNVHIEWKIKLVYQ